jgi:hypothetical protein
MKNSLFNDIRPPKWMLALACLVGIIQLSFVGLMLTALFLGVRWLWQNI